MRTKLKVNHAQSMENGIIFYSRCHKGHVAISTIDEYGNIKAEWTTMKQYKKERKRHKKRKNTFIFLLYAAPICAIFSILLEWMIIKNLILGIRFFFIGFAIVTFIVFLINAYVGRKIEKETYKFHSAEHMVINAYEEIERVPTIEEIRDFSRFSNDCGSNIIPLTIILSIIEFLGTFILNLFCRSMVLGGACFVVFTLRDRGFLNFWQNFTTIPPTDRELNVAIEGMKVWLENEKKEEGEEKKVFKFLHRCFFSKKRIK